MAEIVTLRLPDTLALKAREVAALNHKQLEELLGQLPTLPNGCV